MRGKIELMMAAAVVFWATTSGWAFDMRNAAPVSVRAGDEVVVTGGTALMRGTRTLATLSRGQRLKVLQVEGPWVGAAVTVNGRPVPGWVWHRRVTMPERFVAARPPVRRYSYQPAPARESLGPRSGPYPYATNVLPPDMGDYYTGGLRSGSPLIMGATRYGRNYWRADRKIIGY